MLKTMVKRCLVCGAEFETTQRHAKYCLEHRSMSRSVRERLMQGQGMDPTICAQCGKPFYGHGNARFCSDICRRRNAAAKDDVGTIASMRRKQVGFSVRACHDCGRPTTDYRCPACREKFPQRHGVAADTACGEEWVYA